MKKPEMIIFDYGHTLLYEPGFDTLRGEEALFQYIKSNKNKLTPQHVNDLSQKLFSQIGSAREIGLEMHQHQFQRFLYEYLEIELTIPLSEAEIVFWDNTSSGAHMPYVDTMIDYINANGIRSGVISNIGFSGAALTNRINRLLPKNQFEFIIATSEYLFRKPSPMIFELAIRKAGLSPEDIWFCGDRVDADVEGSAAVGIYPVWYEDQTVENPWKGQSEDMIPSCDHLHICDWRELIEILEDAE